MINFSPTWQGEFALDKLLTVYARTVPHHPAKIRIFAAMRRMLAKRGMFFENALGAKLQLDPMDFITNAICFESAYEPLSLSLAVRLMSRGGTFVDIGANVGLYTCVISRLPNVRCIAFEPAAQASVRLQANVIRNHAVSVTMIGAAAGSRLEFAALELPLPGNLGTMRLAATSNDARPGAVVAVLPTQMALDQVGVKRVDLLKLDVEGAELDVLRGLDMRGSARPLHIISEHLAGHTQQDQLAQCFNLLSSSGYSPFFVTGEPYDPREPLPEFNIWWRHETADASN